jgi:hypothetical protein
MAFPPWHYDGHKKMADVKALCMALLFRRMIE